MHLGRSRRFRTAGGAIGVLGLAVVIVALPASVLALAGTTVSNSPQTNGRVNTILYVGGTVYIGGSSLR